MQARAAGTGEQSVARAPDTCGSVQMVCARRSSTHDHDSMSAMATNVEFSEFDRKQLTEMVVPVLLECEDISHAFIANNGDDMIVVTNKRLMTINNRKYDNEYLGITSHPWRFVTSWTYDDLGPADTPARSQSGAMTTLWFRVVGLGDSQRFRFPPGTNLRELLVQVASNVLS